MKYRSLFIRWMLLMAAAALAFSCTDDDKSTDGQKYGYAQFHLAKSNTRSEQLDYLHQAAKVRVDIVAEDGANMSQALSLTAYDDATAEYGMQSEKWMLFAGKYTIAGYELFDALDNPLIARVYDTEARSTMSITPGGISLQELFVSVAGRGYVKFQLVKDNAEPVTRADGVRKYPFSNIAAADITVKCLDDNKVTKFEKLPMKYMTVGEDRENDLYYTGVCVCDSLLLLPAGNYTVTQFRTFFDSQHNLLLAETCNDVAENLFVVRDNIKATADVPVTLDEAADYLKDAYALYEIWKKLDGPNWYYRGTAYPKGANWEFDNRDIDLWLAQPGVQILENGRIASINLSGFGAKGDMPKELGVLTELRVLSLGTHSFNTAHGISPSSAPSMGGVVTEEQLRAQTEQLSESFMETYVYTGHPLEQSSKELQYEFEARGANLCPSGRPVNIEPFTRSTVKQSPLPPSDPANFATLVYSLPDEIGNLKKLTTLSIAFSPIKDLPDGLAGCESLTDLAIFTCPNIEKLPAVVARLPKLISLMFSNNGKVSSDTMIEGLRALNAAGEGNPDGHTIQILQIPGQPCTMVPDLTNLKRLGLLNITNCGVEKFEKPFGKNQYFSSFLAGRNKIKELPVDGEGYFVGLHSDFETMDFSHNEFTELPNIFLGNSVYVIRAVSFSSNKISKLQGGDDGTWKGINVATLNLNNNRLTNFPDKLFTQEKDCSQISFLLLQGNNMETIAETAFEGKYSHWLMTLDLSMNKLDKLPESFNPKNMPMLYGLDLSYNRFNRFMGAPLNTASLSTYAFKGQRDANGQRSMREWPNNIGDHVGLRRLFLASNDIRKVTDTELSRLIFMLDISDNPNISIDVSSLCPYITAGQYLLVYDPDQDIRGCDALDLNR